MTAAKKTTAKTTKAKAVTTKNTTPDVRAGKKQAARKKKPAVATKRKSNAGRKTNITDDVIQKLQTALQNGFSVGKACELSGTSPSAYYARMEKDAVFQELMTKAQNWTLEKARQNVTTAIAAGDPQTTRWYLERKAREEFGNRVGLDAVVKESNPLDALTPEQIAKIDADMLAALGGGIAPGIGKKQS